MIEKILERLEKERKICLDESALISASCIERMKAIVQEVAKEYGKDTNVRSNSAWEVIYNKVCELEKQSANMEGWEDVNRCIQLENLLQYFKERLIAPYQKGEPHEQ